MTAETIIHDLKEAISQHVNNKDEVGEYTHQHVVFRNQLERMLKELRSRKKGSNLFRYLRDDINRILTMIRDEEKAQNAKH